MCGGAETREGKAPAGGYGGIIEPPARVATMRTQFPERVTNPQNKGTFAKRLKMLSRRMSKKTCRHGQGEHEVGVGRAVFCGVQCEHKARGTKHSKP